jgi:hypothetical protein
VFYATRYERYEEKKKQRPEGFGGHVIKLASCKNVHCGALKQKIAGKKATARQKFS